MQLAGLGVALSEPMVSECGGPGHCTRLYVLSYCPNQPASASSNRVRNRTLKLSMRLREQGYGLD